MLPVDTSPLALPRTPAEVVPLHRDHSSNGDFLLQQGQRPASWATAVAARPPLVSRQCAGLAQTPGFLQKQALCAGSGRLPLRTSSERGAAPEQLPPRSCIRAKQQSRRGYRLPCDWALLSREHDLYAGIIEDISERKRAEAG
jgi:hypothetical protein